MLDLPPPSAPPLNVIVIIADDLGYGDLGPYGGHTVPTPCIDRLAATGRVFTQAHAPAATCTPSRYSLLTGEYAWRRPRKQTSILAGDAPLAIDTRAVTLPRLFQQAGRATALIGKWHLGIGDGRAPLDFNATLRPGPIEIGFDQAFYIPATVDRVPCVFIENHRVYGLDPADPIRVSYEKRVGDDPVGTDCPGLLRYGADLQHAGTIINGISRIGWMSGGHSARWVDEQIGETLTRRAVAFIEANRDRPFFLYLGTHAPHVPHAPHPRFAGSSNSGLRGDSIAEIDHAVGRVLDTLERHRLTGRTLVILTSDNGPILYDGYNDGAEESAATHRPAGGLRGWKYQRYEGGTRIPLIVGCPGRVTPGRSSQLISLVDFTASFAAILGQKLPPGAAPDSIDLSQVLLGDSAAPGRAHIVEQAGNNDLAIRTARWKYLSAAKSRHPSGFPAGGALPADPRARRRMEDKNIPATLYDLAADPAEQSNVIDRHPDVAAGLAARLEAIVQGRDCAEALLNAEQKQASATPSKNSD